MGEVKFLKHLPWFVLFLLFVSGTTLWVLFVREQQNHLRVAFQGQLERLGDELLRSRLEGRLGPNELPEGIRTFAVYGPQGEVIGAWGEDVPPSVRDIPGMGLAGGPAFLRADRGWIGFVKVLRPLRPRLDVWGDSDDKPGPELEGPGMMGPPGRRGQGFLFVRVSEAPLVSKMLPWTLGGIAGVLGWAGFLTFVGVLWFRTRRYQAALVQHRELIQFAEAARTLGHELQNPLAAILLQTALLKRGSAEGPAPEVTVIEEEALRMSALVSRVRDFLKDPSGQTEPIDLAGMVTGLQGRFPIDFGLTLPPTGPWVVNFDRHRLRSVVENLIKNAGESGPDPRPQVVFSRPRAGWIRVEVLDSGTGFTPESLKNALNPFYTTKTTGTGIGLAIADGFVKAAGGRLKLENRPEGGARVTLDLPDAPAGEGMK